MNKQEREEQHRERLIDGIRRHCKAAENNLKLITSALYDENFKEAERWRRHAYESFENLAELLKEVQK